MKKIIKSIIEEIDDINYENRFLYFAQNLFCYKHDIDELKYNKLLENLSFKNSYKFINKSLMSEKLEGLLLADLISNFDSYLDKEQRGKTGSYYTPPVLAESMVKRTMADYFVKNGIIDENKCEKLFFENINLLTKEEIKELDRHLKSIKIIDISCGTGIFISKVIEVLLNLYQIINFEFDILSLTKQLFAVDLQSKPLEILVLIIYDYLLENKVDFDDLPNLNISCQDTLLEEIPFNFKFDIVIGNPPYLGEKGNKELFGMYKNTPHLSDYYEGRMDLFYYFIYRGHEILKPDGVLTYITTNYFVTADGASKLRNYLKTNISFLRIINFDECKLFSSAKGMHNMIFTLSNTFIDRIKIQYIDKSQKEFKAEDIYYGKYGIDQNKLFSEDGNIVVYESKDYFTIIDKIINKSDYRLKEVASINQGIVSGADRVTDMMLRKKLSSETVLKNDIRANEGIYVLDDTEKLESDHFKPFYKNSDISNYFVSEDTNKKILYILDDIELEEESLEWKHLYRFYDVLSLRREVMNGRRKWFSLQWGREQSIFEGMKIVVPQRSMKNVFGLSTEPFYASADVYYITKTELPIKYLLAVLNSKLMFFWLYNRGKRKGKSLELYAKPLSQIPIMKMDSEDELILIDCIDRILENKKNDQSIINEIDEKLYEYYDLTNEEILIIEELYNK